MFFFYVGRLVYWLIMINVKKSGDEKGAIAIFSVYSSYATPSVSFLAQKQTYPSYRPVLYSSTVNHETNRLPCHLRYNHTSLAFRQGTFNFHLRQVLTQASTRHAMHRASVVMMDRYSPLVLFACSELLRWFCSSSTPWEWPIWCGDLHMIPSGEASLYLGPCVSLIEIGPEHCAPSKCFCISAVKSA